MSRSKDENQLMAKDPSNIFRLIPSGIGGLIADYLPVNDVLEVMRSSITTHNLFKPNLHAKKARASVVQGNVKALMFIAKNHPEALFQKGMIIDPRERIFHNASAFQLIHFLCDVDMKMQVMALIPPERCHKERQQQMAELGRGGADLVKLDRSPMLMSGHGFNELTEFKQTFTLFDGTQREVTFPLLENVDGIIYYQDEYQDVHLYYANRNTQHIIPLAPIVTSEEDQKSLTAFKASFDTMEMNSARRSSDAEHQLITKLLQRTLQRQGICYEHNKIRYTDSRTAFGLIHAYRTSIRLYEEAQQNSQWNKANNYWREGVGLAQGVEMWLLQRICEENRPFHPLPAHFNGFKREVTLYNWISGAVESVFVVGRLAAGLGSDFALYKVGGTRPAVACGAGAGRSADLVAVCRLVEDAKANIIERSLESELILQASNPPQH